MCQKSNWDIISALVWTFFLVPFRLKKGKIESSSCRIPQSSSLFDSNAFTRCACVYLILFIRSRSDSDGGVFGFYLWIGRETFIVSSLRFWRKTWYGAHNTTRGSVINHLLLSSYGGFGAKHLYNESIFVLYVHTDVTDSSAVTSSHRQKLSGLYLGFNLMWKKKTVTAKI